MATTQAAPTTPTPAATGPTPVIIDLGEKCRKNVKKLRRGEGKLMAQVQQAIRELQGAGRVAAGAQPVIIVVREKPESLFGF